MARFPSVSKTGVFETVVTGLSSTVLLRRVMAMSSGSGSLVNLGTFYADS
jgi:hypothetical protein